MSGWRSLILGVAAFVFAVSAAFEPAGSAEDAYRIVWAIFLTGAMICSAIEERGER